MIRLNDDILRFFKKQHFVIVSTICGMTGKPHNSCKGIVNINKGGIIYLLDLYKGRTHENLKKNTHISITAVDEHRFQGWCIKGRAKIITGKKVTPDIIRAWEDKIAGRITHRLLKNIKEERRHKRHPEAQLPMPEYLIVMETEEIVDLSPGHVR